jgi:hypothetical protein
MYIWFPNKPAKGLSCQILQFVQDCLHLFARQYHRKSFGLARDHDTVSLSLLNASSPRPFVPKERRAQEPRAAAPVLGREESGDDHGSHGIAMPWLTSFGVAGRRQLAWTRRTSIPSRKEKSTALPKVRLSEIFHDYFNMF